VGGKRGGGGGGGGMSGASGRRVESKRSDEMAWP